MAITFTSPPLRPGAAGYAAISGPLKALFGNTLSTGNKFLQYPSDLGSESKGHMVVFTAMSTQPTGYGSENQTAMGIVGTALNLAEGIAAVAGMALGITGAGYSGLDDIKQITSLTWQPKRVTSGDVISLYMPDTINFTSESSYSDVSLKEAGENAAAAVGGDTVSSAISAVNSQAAQLALNKEGRAINPQQQLLFDGIDFRSYQLAFQFTPKNQAESDTIKNIIKTFRIHAAPKIDSGGGGMFFKVPDSFILQFVQLNGGENQYITKVKESVLTSVDVNYSPNGIWSAHADGSPTQINLTLSFKEIALIDQTAIENGF